MNEPHDQERVGRLGEGKRGDPHRCSVPFRTAESLKRAETESEAAEPVPSPLPGLTDAA
jgi:hypothetical protein